jgi:hypothetical protein
MLVQICLQEAKTVYVYMLFFLSEGIPMHHQQLLLDGQLLESWQLLRKQAGAYANYSKKS